MSAREWQQRMERVQAGVRRLRLRLREWRTARRALRELELGRNPDGSTVVLDYKSGQLMARRAPATSPLHGPLVAYDYADLAWMERVAGLAGYRAAIDKDGDLEIQTEAGPVYIRRGDDLQIIRVFMRVVDGTETLGDERYELVNVLNLQANLGRWVLNDHGVLFMSCDLYAGAGITSAQLLKAVRAVSHEVSVAMAQLGFDRDTAE